MERFRTLFEMAAPSEGETTTGTGRPMLSGVCYDMGRLCPHGARRVFEIGNARLPAATGT